MHSAPLRMSFLTIQNLGPFMRFEFDENGWTFPHDLELSGRAFRGEILGKQNE